MNARSAQPARGIALLVALLVTAIATALIAMLLDEGSVALARTRAYVRAGQADELARGLEAYAIDVLRRDASVDAVDSNGDAWAQGLPPTPVPGGTVGGRMFELNGRFNLNSLVKAGQRDPRAMQRCRLLLLALEMDPIIVEALADWIDPDSNADAGGAEDNYYLGLDPPYRAANRAFLDVSELRRVRGITPEIYAKLLPLVTALPGDSLLNINTAPPLVLMALDQRINKAIADRLSRDGAAHYASIDDFRQALQDEGVVLSDLPPDLGVKSEYFQTRAEIVLDAVPMTREALLVRNQQGTRVIARWAGPR